MSPLGHGAWDLRYNHRSYGTLAQLVEQGTFNPKVAGSTPARPTTKPQAGRGVVPPGLFVCRNAAFAVEAELADSTAQSGFWIGKLGSRTAPVGGETPWSARGSSKNAGQEGVGREVFFPASVLETSGTRNPFAAPIRNPDHAETSWLWESKRSGAWGIVV